MGLLLLTCYYYVVHLIVACVIAMLCTVLGINVYYTFEKRYYVSDQITRFVCLCVFVSVITFVMRCLDLAYGISEAKSSLRLQHYQDNPFLDLDHRDHADKSTFWPRISKLILANFRPNFTSM